MTTAREALAAVRTFPELVRYLRDELDWPIGSTDFEDLTYDYTPEELGIDRHNSAKIQEIKRLKPLAVTQPWGVFFVAFEPARLPVVALRRILSSVALKKRASANHAERAAWDPEDLLFISSFGESDSRQLSFARFAQSPGSVLPTLNVLGWDNLDTPLHVSAVAETLNRYLRWPVDPSDKEAWRTRWRAAFGLRHREVITTSKALAIRLAMLAREIRDRITTILAVETERGHLTMLMSSFRESLIHDLDVDEFADMYAQTIAYGLLSARIANPSGHSGDLLAGSIPITNPFLRELMATFLHVGAIGPTASVIDFDELGVSDVVELLEQANMEAVVRDFGDRNPLEDPVTHFYEGFAREYDPTDKVRRGEFYTPRPVVSFIVRSVDEQLRSEFGLDEGLADTTTWGEMLELHPELDIPQGTSREQPFVQVLDPATGTGTFLVEVIDFIHKTLGAKWAAQGHTKAAIQALWNQYVPKHLLPRLHAYELKMAPYAIAHLKVGLKLFETGYRFASDERARIYLTNALEPASDLGQLKLEGFLPALAHEAQAVNEIKRKRRFTVVLGNPPYAAISSNLTPDLRRVVEPYRFVDGERIRERSMLQFEKNIQDDYVKFFAFAQARLDESSSGIVSMITNHSYLDGPTLRGVRWNLVSRSQSSWFLDLHGNANKAEVAPDGIVDENVFDIRQGVAICLLVKRPYTAAPVVRSGDLWGTRAVKYRQLSSLGVSALTWTPIDPTSPYYYLSRPDSEEFAAEWAMWPAVSDLFSKRSTGVETGFDDLLLNFTKAELKARVDAFAATSASPEMLSTEFDVSGGHAAALFERRHELRTVRDEEFRPFQLRAYDYRWALLRKNVLKTNSFNVMLDLGEGAPGLVTTRQTKEGFAAFAVKTFCGHKVTSSYDRSYVLPLFARNDGELLAARTPLLDRKDLDAFRTLSRDNRDLQDDVTLALEVFYYVVAVLNAPSYVRHFSQRLKRDWAKVPPPGNRNIFAGLAELGRDLAAIQLLESPVVKGVPSTYFGPSEPLVGRVDWVSDTVWLDAGATRTGEPASSDHSGFRGVSEAAWSFHIGGYQVLAKWLKDRKGRSLSSDDIRHYQEIIAAVTASKRLTGAIDEFIEDCGGWPGAFSAS
jgi:hypothetical protein